MREFARAIRYSKRHGCTNAVFRGNKYYFDEVGLRALGRHARGYERTGDGLMGSHPGIKKSSVDGFEKYFRSGDDLNVEKDYGSGYSG